MTSTLDDFEVLSTIGTGSYGTCKKIKRKKDGKVMVWKEMEYGSMSESEKQMLVSEVNLLRELRHQHIVRYFDRIIDRTRSIIYIIMEYCQGGDLSSIIARNRKEGSFIPEEFAWKILIQTTWALKECHRRKNGKAVLHRDLKPANVFLDAESNVKLGDFGLARVLHHESSFAQTYVGTPYYMSPELVNNLSYNEKSDVWSLGCMLYELCALVPPFTASNQSELNRKIRVGEFSRLPIQYSLELDLIIRKMIQVEVVRRPSIDSILADPIVQCKQETLERRMSAVPLCGDLASDQSGGSDQDLANKQEELQAKMRQLELKEKELESREKSVALREKLAEEKMKKALELLDQYRRGDTSSTTATPVATPRSIIPWSPSQEDCSFGSPHSCLSKGRDPESPKKHVTFHDYLNGKENLRQRSSPYSGLTLNAYTGLYTGREETYTRDLLRRDEVRDRLFSAKDRTSLGSRDIDSRFTSKNLLYFR
ncbi:serine/threonine-protein kinase Nek2 isoform X2 [Aplysia californica]|nr:serine/threonine-protein kinase Nek2 isoform X2 [Aplysia californica]XP_005106237.1 serine/threonine-protein kinase Nek2 isoform X2 [Aplysia californica]